MTTANMTATQARVWSLIAALVGPFEGLADAMRRYRVFRTTYAELDALSTRELDDLGISRSMITRLAHEAAYGPKA